MNSDFTLKIYRKLLLAFQEYGYFLMSFENFLSNISKPNRCVILRQDVDKNPANSLKTAQIQAQLNATATYFFRILPCSYNPAIITSIIKLGHEIGYHYEDLAINRGNHQKALTDFKNNLNRLQELYPVKTICMHGSPLSKWDNKDLWKNVDYKDYGIIGEPYFDVDFSDVFYLTDTGRSWNATDVSVRDKVKTPFSLSFSSTSDIITALKNNEFPNKAMLTIHPQRWNDNLFYWTFELVSQSVKNRVKRYLVKR